jgi:hypothetical protein
MAAEDIEDCVGPTDGEVRVLQKSGSVARQKNRKVDGGLQDEESQAEGVSKVPGTQRIWIKTFGCSHNISDSEVWGPKHFGDGMLLMHRFLCG